MEIAIATFTNPFSFYCKAEARDSSVLDLDRGTKMRSISKSDVSDFNHGEYVAVMWQDKWVRGIVSMESQFLIWLVDYGVYLRPTEHEKTVWVKLPADYKNLPTKVFEASIHGVSPTDKVLTADCQIDHQLATMWNKGATDKAQLLIASAKNTYFVPIAILATKNNDIVLGDLYLQFADKTIVNIVDELQMWPVFLEKNPEAFIKNLPTTHTTRRKHRASLLKPEFPGLDIPTISFETPLATYVTICANVPALDPAEYDSDAADGDTVVTKANHDLDTYYKLTPEEVEKYSRMYITVHDREYNVLNVLLNKLNDLRMCEKYKNHDLKRVGRACSRRRLSSTDDSEI
ncbi:hypothetical protein O0L34_g3964 [Tuta absoluta]|nr:hypothetical protein O0L34_g3964 [Tuta absoluta]